MWRPTFLDGRVFHEGHRMSVGWYPYNPDTRQIAWSKRYRSKNGCRLFCDILNGQLIFTELLETAS